MTLLSPRRGLPPHLDTRHRSKGEEGFALLITITLVAFLVLLLVSIATLTRVETRVAGNSQTLSLARQNALLGLNIALGQLQKYTGPDQRVTARAEILDGDPLDRDSNGQPVIDSSELPHPYWTGVWDSSKWNPLTGVYDGLGVRGRQRPEAIAWLVSGNETIGNTIKPTVALANADTKQALFSGVTTAGAIDTANPRVEVPKVEIQSVVPGMTGDQTVGHYAYWVGDEGVKAKMNTVAPPSVSDEASSGSPASEHYYWKAMNPTRAGGDLVGTAASRAFPDFNDLLALTSTGAESREELRRTLGTEQLSFLQEGSPATSVLPTTELRLHAFDLTTTSQGVLADTVRGGLRLDLTRFLEAGNTDGAFMANDSIYKDAADAGIISGGRQPSFSLLKSWYDIGAGLSGMNPSASLRSEVVAGDVITEMGLYPVITRFHLLYSGMAAGVGQPFTVLIHPSVTLWNPHNVALVAEDMVLEIEQPFTFRVAVESRPASPGPVKRYLVNGGTQYRADDLMPRMGDEPVRVRLEGVRLEPGETVVYTLGNPTTPPAWSPPGAGVSNPASFPLMVPRWNNLNYIAVPMTGLTLDSTPLAPGEHLEFYLSAGPSTASGISWQFRARLYQAAGFPGNAPLQNLENPTAQGIGQITAADPFGGTEGLRAVLPSSPPTDTSVFRGTVATMILPFSFGDNATLVANNAIMVPFAQFNLRGAYGGLTSFEGPRGSLEGDPFFRWTRATGIPAVAVVPGEDKDLAFAGASNNSVANLGNYYVMFDYPRPETAVASNGGSPSMISLGEFQHADLSSFMFQPTYVFGNSWPDPRIYRERVAGRIAEFPATIPQQIANGVNDVYLRDASYLANHALWDRFFLSTIPQTGGAGNLDTQVVLPNTRMKPVAGMIPGQTGFPSLTAVRNVNKAAGSLMLDGAFNVNSTSVDAWRAFLGGLADVPVPNAGWTQSGFPAGGTADPAGEGLRHNYSRFLLPRSHAFNQTAFNATTADGVQSAAAWTGHRYLTDAEIDILARNLVEEVKVRGPFMSIADFVNRRLITAADDNATTLTDDITEHREKVGAAGAIQRAILNLTNTDQGLNAALSRPLFGTPGYTGTYAFRGLYNLPAQFELMKGGLISQLSYGAPGFLTQADVLQKIGGAITARSDTFVIRTYGDVYNPVTDQVEGQAWCEAVVQRFPEYVDASQPPEAGSSALGAAALNSTNQVFGRRYKVVSFRWLSAADL